MKKIAFLTFFACSLGLQAGLITSIPSPDDQGGMIMPMVSITGANNNMNPTSGNLSISFNPSMTPVLNSLQTWSPGSWFADTKAWTSDIGSPAGVGGTPALNAGNGDLFNSQYGFTYMANPMMGMANIPTGKSLGLKLTSATSELLRAFNYSSASNRWDEVFQEVGDQVLWNGQMWHTVFTLPELTAPGNYSATFEVFIANTAFTSGTGAADYSAAALAATADPNFNSAFITYNWTGAGTASVPEPSTWAMATLLAIGIVSHHLISKRRRNKMIVSLDGEVHSTKPVAS